jgi:hypothetical protein
MSKKVYCGECKFYVEFRIFVDMESKYKIELQCRKGKRGTHKEPNARWINPLEKNHGNLCGSFEKGKHDEKCNICKHWIPKKDDFIDSECKLKGHKIKPENYDSGRMDYVNIAENINVDCGEFEAKQ